MKELINKADSLSLQIVDAMREGVEQSRIYELQNELDETLYQLRQF